MSKKKNDAPAIVAGKAVTITADTRKDAKKQLDALRKQAKDAGLVQGEGGFIEYRDGIFSAIIKFVDN